MKKRFLAVGLLAAALAFTWQALTVHYNYGGNWTALFCTGGNLQVPPDLTRENIYLFLNSSGYDGQFYHYLAHDPFLQRGFDKFMDAPRLRYRRILVPAAAYLLAGGQDRFVDAAFIGVILLAVFLGAWWLSRYAGLQGWHPAWGLGFLLVPATVVSIDRMTIDLTLAALTVGFAFYARLEETWKVWAVLCCAALTRETGILLLAGYVAYLLWRRRFAWAAFSATAATPVLAWYAYIHPRTIGDLFTGQHGHPLQRSVFTPRLLLTIQYDLPDMLARTLRTLDWLVIAGIVLAFVMTLWFALRRPHAPESFAGLMYALMLLPTVLLVSLHDPYTYPRIVSPLLVLVALQGISGKVRLGLLPLVLVLLRPAVQLGPQVLGVLRGLLGR
jgi:hypothetical protein